MKKTMLLLAACLCFSSAWSQNLSKNESKALQAFLSQPAKTVGTNGSALKYDGKNLSSVEGLKIENGHVTEISWRGKDLAGELSLTSFPALAKVDVSRNALTGLTVASNPELVELNASSNRLPQVSLENNSQLQNINLNRNRLSTIDLGGVVVVGFDYFNVEVLQRSRHLLQRPAEHRHAQGIVGRMNDRCVMSQIVKNRQLRLAEPGDAGQQRGPGGPHVVGHRRQRGRGGEVDGHVRHPPNGLQIGQIADVYDAAYGIAVCQGGLLDQMAHAAMSDEKDFHFTSPAFSSSPWSCAWWASVMPHSGRRKGPTSLPI